MQSVVREFRCRTIQRGFLLYVALLLSACSSGPIFKTAADEEVRRLCAIDGGINVYQKVSLPIERFDKNGFINIPDVARAAPDAEYYRESDIYYYYQSGQAGMDAMWKTTTRIVRRSDKKIMGVSISYTRRGGDAPGPWHPSSYMCPAYSTGQPQLETSVFIKGDPN